MLRPNTRQIRSKLDAFAGVFGTQVKLLRGNVPSYVADAAESLLTALDRWAKDEREVSK